MGICLNKEIGPQGPPGPQGLPGKNCEENCDETFLPNAPSYPFPECGTCERVDGNFICSNFENKDKFYVLAVRNDNSTYWREIDLTEKEL